MREVQDTQQPEGIWDMLGEQVQHLHKQLPRAGHTTGVNRYLALAARTNRTLNQMFPREPKQMADNLERFMVDCVLSYVYWDASTATMRTTKAVAAGSAIRYTDEVAKYWRERVDSTEPVHLRPSVAKTKAFLRKSLPAENKQKTGITAEVLQRIVAQARQLYGHGSMQAALMLYMWAALLRPGEVVTTQRHRVWDISRHPAWGDVKFFDGRVQRHPGDGKGVPRQMHACIKDSKTDKRRLTANVVIGATGLEGMCPVAAMWAWMQSNGHCDSTAPLFHVGGAPYTYTQLRRLLRDCLKGAGVQSAESYGGHSFRVGGAQALALAGKSTPYIMSMGRWSCVESVLTYVQTPVEIRVRDTRDMMTAMPTGHAATATVVRTAQEVVAASTARAARLRYQWGV